MILAVPTFFAVTVPADVTVAMVVSEDLKDLLPLLPVMDTVVVLPTATDEAPAFAVIDWAALATFTVIVFVAWL